MVKAGTPLTEVAEVLGVSRTTLYRHLKTTPPSTTTAVAVGLAPVVVRPVPPVGEQSRPVCPSCGGEPATRAEAMALRADLAVLWLHPDPDHLGQVVQARHCRGLPAHRVGGVPGPALAGGRRVECRPRSGLSRAREDAFVQTRGLSNGLLDNPRIVLAWRARGVRCWWGIPGSGCRGGRPVKSDVRGQPSGW